MGTLECTLALAIFGASVEEINDRRYVRIRLSTVLGRQRARKKQQDGTEARKEGDEKDRATLDGAPPGPRLGSSRLHAYLSMCTNYVYQTDHLILARRVNFVTLQHLPMLARASRRQSSLGHAPAAL